MMVWCFGCFSPADRWLGTTSLWLRWPQRRRKLGMRSRLPPAHLSMNGLVVMASRLLRRGRVRTSGRSGRPDFLGGTGWSATTSAGSLIGKEGRLRSRHVRRIVTSSAPSSIGSFVVFPRYRLPTRSRARSPLSGTARRSPAGRGRRRPRAAELADWSGRPPPARPTGCRPTVPRIRSRCPGRIPMGGFAGSSATTGAERSGAPDREPRGSPSRPRCSCCPPRRTRRGSGCGSARPPARSCPRPPRTGWRAAR